MTGLILDGVLMLLLVAALGYGVRLEKKLALLRAGHAEFAKAVAELNTAAGRAEAALASLRASNQETDLLHDRIVKARAIKAELEQVMARAEKSPVAASPKTTSHPAAPVDGRDETSAMPRRAERDHEAAAGPAQSRSLAERIHALSTPAAPGRDNVRAIVQAMTANQAAKESLNRARLKLDDDLFAA
ncbi:DUF6468 domain-containing protein [Brevundimonas balnearis]|uniref:DUF6468 domain-containing protein n=1 Tax=Brevundimonas balnearis TaxID=1572858 RepID=A0ABV6R5S3_9CAUL